jgi:tripartite-type tricarboxylate transporter receptor subunit TctC
METTMKNFIRAVALLIALSLLIPFGAAAQGYPNKPIRIIVAYAGGAGVDVAARIVAERLSQSMKAQVYVENRDGAGGLIGTMTAAKAAPDGYTLLMASSPVTVLHFLQPEPTYDPVKDFTAVARVSLHPLVLVTSTKSRYTSFNDLIAAIKANPGKLNYATSGKGSSSHLEFELLKQRYGLDIPDVPYKSFATAITDTITGRADLFLSAYSAALPHIKSGSVRALAMSSQKRSELLPDVPTLAELTGDPNYEASVSYGLLAPVGTPNEIVVRLAQEVAKVANDPATAERIRAIGGEPAVLGPAQYGAQVKAETEKWDRLVTAIGMKVLK